MLKYCAALVVIAGGFAWWGIPVVILLGALAAGLISGVCAVISGLTQNSFCGFFSGLWVYYALVPFIIPWVLPVKTVSLEWNWLYAVASLLIGATATSFANDFITTGPLRHVFLNALREAHKED